MKFVLKNKLTLAYSILENKNKETIVFLNGLTQSFEVWEPCKILLQKKYQLLFLDIINQGNSTKGKRAYTFDEQAIFLCELLVYLKIKKVWIAGISYGSLVAQQFGNLFPQKTKGLILISSFAKKNNYYSMIEENWENSLKKEGYDGFLHTILPFVLGKTFFETKEFSATRLIQDRLKSPIKVESLLYLMQTTKNRKDFLEELTKMIFPILILHGEEDILFPIEMAQEIFANTQKSTLTVLKKTGHTINVEQPKKLSKEISRFIKKNQAYSS